MTFTIIRCFFVLLCGLMGYQLGDTLRIGALSQTIGVVVGVVIAGIIIALEYSTKRVSVKGLSSAVFGIVFGILFAWLIIGVFKLIPLDADIKAEFNGFIILVFAYLGMIMAVRGKDEFNIIIPYIKLKREGQREEIALLDTSVIIDGRIADICHTKFIQGILIIPRFVLKELQQIADSADPIKRNRGRRGLDMLNKIRKSGAVEVKIHEDDFPDITEVDAKLIKLAKMLSAKVFTNDYNLNKIAELQGVAVLNINELANALKPVVIPGELMEVKIVKEGKEYNQAVAYLDDGTMVVIDNAKQLIGHTAKVLVTSVLQTAAGRMIFAKVEAQK
ncbi:MAG TPA: TRAM domain-containing protein [Candidatus Omnitrophota bacterium]|nr:TRAM domain-containing protein [Candidatus Omnitrophota bacterium]HOX10040.1 TRAM domain-containing protein [Candidatus Omnitrophota bacterium]HRZ67185.1 TRAM domain-containing protein [Candidatus Omnitrophota bacterium]